MLTQHFIKAIKIHMTEFSGERERPRGFKWILWLIDLDLNLISIILINSKHFKNVCYVVFTLFFILCFVFAHSLYQQRGKVCVEETLGNQHTELLISIHFCDYGLRTGYIGKEI